MTGDAVGDEVQRFHTWMKRKTHDPNETFRLDPGTRQEYRRRLYDLLSQHDPADITVEELDGRAWSAFVTYLAFLADDYLDRRDEERLAALAEDDTAEETTGDRTGLLQRFRSWLTTDGPGITDHPEVDITAHRSMAKTLQAFGLILFILSSMALGAGKPFAVPGLAGSALMYALGADTKLQALRWQVELLEEGDTE